ncbi:MAG: aminotransferase class V-fold PLP-dependent enzyme [Bernardetiaceae bacterium]|nr:aminotransferase class V-fold PLP-dependent enzyme [Bernardetiaceae bacterium]
MTSTTRRKFLRQLTGVAGGFAFAASLPFDAAAYAASFSNFKQLSVADACQDEDFWHFIKQSYTVSPALLNLNNGGVSPQPRVVQNALARYNELSNEAPSYYMWRVLDQGREPIRRRLADLAGVEAEEIAINRNASEALETVIFGLRLERGDEVILTKQDYPNMIHAWKQRELRDGIKLKWLSFDFPIEDKAKIVSEFVNAFSKKTKVVHLTHMINWNGQILPVREIADEARKRNIEVLVDGAHTFAHLDFKISDLNCDYFGTSLHKWLCAPFGSGMLYVRKSKIKNLFPLFAPQDPESDDIRKFEALGTRSFPIEQAIGQAIDFQLMIGSERKTARLHYLKKYWLEEAQKLDKVHIHTSLDSDFSCAIGMFSIEGKTIREVDNALYSKFKIHTVAIEWENINGIRVTPHVYTTKKDLQRLLEAIDSIRKS